MDDHSPKRLPTIYFVRHGETDWNAEGRLQGRRDVALNALGQRQADAAGAMLRQTIADPAAVAFVSSPMARTRETMARVRGALGLEREGYAVDPRLTEIAFGKWEGQTWRDIRDREPAAYAARRANMWDYVPPGGESYADLARRIGPVIYGLTTDTVVVSHGGVARALTAMLCNTATIEAVRLDIWQGRILVITDGCYTWTEPAKADLALQPET